MKRLNKSAKQRWPWLLAAALILALVLALVLWPGKDISPPDPELSQDPSFLTGPEDTDPGIGVITPYMTLYYPLEWNGIVTVQQSTDGKNETVIFLATLSGQETELFRVLLGPSAAQGHLVGCLDDLTAGTINVFTEMAVLDPADWSGEDYAELSSMQERVNDIIMQVHEDPRFVPG